MPQANILDMYHGDNREEMPDFVALKNAGIIAIFHKASQGLHYRDPLFVARIKAISAAGILPGAYHFLDASDPQGQLDNFNGAVAAAGTIAQLAYGADYEKTASTPALSQLMTFVQLNDTANACLTYIYSSDLIRETLQPHPGGHMAANMAGHEDFFRKHWLWLAEYGPHENIPWPWNTPAPGPNNASNPVANIAPGAKIWQFSATGREPGIVGAVDLNYYAGTAADLAQHWVK